MQEFVVSPASGTARSRRWTWGTVAVLVPLLLFATHFSPPVVIVIVPALLLLLAFDVAGGKTRPGRRIALVDDAGIESPLFSTRTKRHGWDEIAAASVEGLRAGRVLQLRLRPKAGAASRGWFGRRARAVRLRLGALTLQQQEELMEAVLQHLQPDPAAPARGNELREERLFREQLVALAPVPWLTWVIIGANALAWLAMTLQGGNGVRASSEALLAWGANSSFEVLQHGQWWRLMTATFLHAGLMHLAMNMLGLWSAGTTVERLYGRRLYALVYLGSALVGSALSLHFSAQRTISVGASGAVFGVAGAMLVALYRYRHALPRISQQAIGGIGFFIAYSLLQGFTHPGIDNAAHVGGLAAGCVLAALLPQRLEPELFAHMWRPAGVVGAALVAASVGVLATTASPGVDQRAMFSSLHALEHALRQMDAAGEDLLHDEQAMAAGRLTQLQVDERTRTVHAPRFRAVLRELDGVQLVPEDPRAPYAADARRLAELTVEMLAMPSKVVDGKPVPVDAERFAADRREAHQVSLRMRAFVEQLKTRRRS